MKTTKRIFMLRALFSACIAICLNFLFAAHTASPEKPKGAKAAAHPVVQPASACMLGQWSGTIEMNAVPVHISLLPDKRLLYWGRDKENGYDVKDRSWTYLLNLNDRNVTPILNTTTNLFCSGHSFLPDGRLLVTGGHDRYDPLPLAEGIGERDINIFDYRTSQWTRMSEQMEKGRWYPFNVTLEDGSVMTFGGRYWNGVIRDNKPVRPINDIPERVNPQGTSLQRYYNAGPINTEEYPMVHLMPDGNVLLPAPKHSGNNTNLFLPSITDPETQAFTNMGKNWFSFYQGTSVLYDAVKGKVLVVGGATGIGTAPINSAVTFDYSTGTEYRQTPESMTAPRVHHTTTLLPDGKVLVTGGSKCAGNSVGCDNGQGAITSPELWDPATGAWCLMAASPSGRPRVYHSTAILLPDATVLVAGGGLPLAGGEKVPGTNETCIDGQDRSVACRTAGHTEAEIFSPPYLYTSSGELAPRPSINYAPTGIGYGQNFFVTTGNSADIKDIVLVRLGSVTHGFNQDQRRVVLNFTTSGSTGLNVTGPANGRLAPPGPYMLFLINQAGTPSQAQIVTVSSQAVQTLDGENYIGRRIIKSNDRVHLFYRHLGDRTLRYMAQAAPDSNNFAEHVDLGGTLTSNPLAIHNPDGTLEVFVVGSNNKIYSIRQSAPGSTSWGVWKFTGAVSGSPSIAVAANLDGRLMVFYRGVDNSLRYIIKKTPGSIDWKEETSLGGWLTSDPAVGMNADGRLEVFLRGSDNGLYHIWQNAAGIENGFESWSSWAGMGGSLTAAPYVAHNADGRLDVFVRGAANRVYHRWQTIPNSNAWSGYEGLGGSAFDHPSNIPVVSRNADGRLQVFLRWDDSTLRTMVQDTPNGRFTPNAWTVLWGGTTATISPPARSRDGRLFMFTRGTDSGLYFSSQSAANSSLIWGAVSHLGEYAHSF